MEMDPGAPAPDGPVVNSTVPEFPDAAPPVDMSSWPLSPNSSTSPVANDNAPVVPMMESPDRTCTAPVADPLATVPELSTRWPLRPVSSVSPVTKDRNPVSPMVVPEDNTTVPEPPEAPVETPDPNVSVPVVPRADVPEENSRAPDTPAAIALAVRSVTAPVDADAPEPDTTANSPSLPIRAVEWPERRYRCPPSPLVVDPTASDMEPAAPEAAAPVARTT